MDTLGKRIKSIREKSKWSQLDLAKKLGLESAMAISKYESDQREPDISKLIKLSELGNVDLGWLLTGEGPQYTKKITEGEGFIAESTAKYSEGQPENDRLIELIEKLRYIYKEGGREERAWVRGVIEEAFDEMLKKTSKKEEPAA